MGSLAAQTAEAETEICSFSGEGAGISYSCEVPGVRTVCCDINKAFAKCASSTDPSCFTGVFDSISDKLQSAGIDAAKLATDPSYGTSVCPVLSSLSDKATMEKYCTISQSSVASDPSLSETEQCSFGDASSAATFLGSRRCVVT